MSLVDRILKVLPIKRKERPEKRDVHVGVKPSDGHEPQRFPSNRVVSSKYTIINFLPKNLFEQFQRIANLYFLCVLLVELIIDSPVSPITSGLPLAFVVILTALKQGYEDFLRHRADKEVNKSPAYVFRDGHFIKVESHEIVVGDIVKVNSNEGIPCDMVMLSSSSSDGECFITTANLDGETNLKKFRAPLETKSFTTVEKLLDLKLKIECEQPTTNLYKFIGSLTVFGEENSIVPLSAENVLLRGCCLRNTDFVMGCAIYTGQETKMGLNSRKSSIKFSRIEKTMNRYLLFFLGVLFFESALLTGLKHNFFSIDENKNLWYIDSEDSPSFIVILEEFLAFMILLNYTIPISMYVTVELQKFFGSMFFQWDIDMYDSKTDETARAITSDLNEELGQIEYLFTDKTGTLTENNMKFRQCSVNGIKYVDVHGKLCRKEENIQPQPLKSNDEVIDLLKAIALCHTVRVEKVNKLNGVVNKGFTNDEESIQMSVLNDSSDDMGHNYNFQASSPDEKALVEACRDYGVVFHGVYENVFKLGIGKVLKSYKLVHTLEFDPTRKRMGVMLADERGDVTLYVKGADSHMVPRLVGDQEKVFSACSDYAKEGLRTLVIAKRDLSPTEFERDNAILREAHNSVIDRDEKVAEAYEQVERDLTLLGVTAVEDELQDGVPETLTSLREAGIKVWVLTGDKEETAVNISYFAGHFDKSMEEMRLTNRHTEEDCIAFLKQNKKILSDNIHKQYALIIDGQSLAIAQKSCKELLQDVCFMASTVLCCRMSPIQKANVVKLIKDSKKNPTTAAIGDGANDVSMIQEAHVGIGLMGKEGRQAVRASDYAFGRFKFLKKAILVHGHYFYVRLAILVQYFFYKNVAFITANVYFAFFSAYTAQSIYDSFCLMLYNITFTSLPILLYGLFEQHIPQKVLLDKPKLFRSIRHNARLSWFEFAKWNTVGLWHSVVSFFGIYIIVVNGNSIEKSGQQYGIYEMGSLVYTICVFTVNFKLMFESNYWCVVTFIGFFISFAGYFLLTVVYSVLHVPMFFTPIFYGSFAKLCGNIMWWITILGLVITSLIPDILLRTIQDSTNGYQKPIYRRTSGRYDNTPEMLSNAVHKSIPYERHEDCIDHLQPRSVTIISDHTKGFTNPTYDSAMESTHL